MKESLTVSCRRIGEYTGSCVMQNSIVFVTVDGDILDIVANIYDDIYYDIMDLTVLTKRS